MIALLAGFALVFCAVIVLVILAAVVWSIPPAPRDAPGPAQRAVVEADTQKWIREGTP